MERRGGAKESRERGEIGESERGQEGRKLEKAREEQDNWRVERELGTGLGGKTESDTGAGYITETGVYEQLEG